MKRKVEKLQNEERIFFFFLLSFFFFFFFFCFSLLKTTKMKICFGSTRMGIFYREKTFHAGKKSGKIFSPSEKYACYAPVSRQMIQSDITCHFEEFYEYINCR